VLGALNPVHTLSFLSSHGAASFIVLGAGGCSPVTARRALANADMGISASSRAPRLVRAWWGAWRLCLTTSGRARCLM